MEAMTIPSVAPSSERAEFPEIPECQAGTSGNDNHNETSKSSATAKPGGITAFFVFSNELRESVRHELEQAAPEGSKVGIGEVAKRIGELWKALCDEDRARYKAIATEVRELAPPRGWREAPRRLSFSEPLHVKHLSTGYKQN